MNRLTRPLRAALVPMVALGAAAAIPAVASAAPVAPASPTAPPSTNGTPTWQALQQTALKVAANAQGVNVLNLAGLPSVPVQTTLNTPSGPQPLSQQTVVTTGNSGTVVVNLAMVGKQEIVSEMNVNQNYQGETLVLAPGSSTVTNSYHLAGATHASANAQAFHGHAKVITASDGVYRSGAGAKANLTAAYGCFAYPQAPSVIGSIYGPLIQGEGIISCSSGSATLAMIIGIYENNGAQKGSAGGSGWGNYYALNAYAPCYQTSWNWFQTAELWAVNGAGQPGASSGWSYLGCG